MLLTLPPQVYDALAVQERIIALDSGLNRAMGKLPELLTVPLTVENGLSQGWCIEPGRSMRPRPFETEVVA